MPTYLGTYLGSRSPPERATVPHRTRIRTNLRWGLDVISPLQGFPAICLYDLMANSTISE
jgi:hypothetical protein